MGDLIDSPFLILDAVKERPDLKRIREVFHNASDDEYVAFADFLVSGNQTERFKFFMYYILLFRDDQRVQGIINSDRVSVGMLEHLVLYAYGYAVMKKIPPDRVLDDILYFLSEERLLELCVAAEHMSRDFLFVIFILTRLPVAKIDEFFSKSPHTKRIIHSFTVLPDRLIREIIYRNVVLFDFILSVMPVFLDEKSANDFRNRYDELIEKMRELNNLIMMYKTGREVYPNKKELSRIAILVTIMTKYSDINMDIFNDHTFLTSRRELEIARAVAKDPMFVNLLKDIRKNNFFASASVELF